MRSPTFSTILPLLSLAAADSIPAVQRDAAAPHIDKRQSTNPFLGKRAVCNAYYPEICYIDNGPALCVAVDETCCANPMTGGGAIVWACPPTYPYCCNRNGYPTCATDASCKSGQFEAAQSRAAYTETTGPKPTAKSPSVAPSVAATVTVTAAGNGPTTVVTAKPVASKPNAAGSRGGGSMDGSMLAALVLVGLAVL
ncbi:hypothetical protein GQ44DRAFT_779620 [Phaeosphaeriaceae sp. PMI808]|nr:hypothetical protein GQ44DRAFT_779620 [Phaeosphaeriaceae sp. PMI808]